MNKFLFVLSTNGKKKELSFRKEPQKKENVDRLDDCPSIKK